VQAGPGEVDVSGMKIRDLAPSQPPCSRDSAVKYSTAWAQKKAVIKPNLEGGLMFMS